MTEALPLHIIIAFFLRIFCSRAKVCNSRVPWEKPSILQYSDAVYGCHVSFWDWLHCILCSYSYVVGSHCTFSDWIASIFNTRIYSRIHSSLDSCSCQFCNDTSISGIFDADHADIALENFECNYKKQR